MLVELLRIKTHREDKAEMNLVKSRLVLVEVSRRADEARESLTQYQRWSAEHELSLYGAMYGRRVRPRDLELLREDVVILRTKERSLADSFTKVDGERQEADKTVREARATHEQATRTREKFVQLVNAQTEEIRLEDERKEDLEMEDLHTGRRDRDDWEEPDDE